MINREREREDKRPLLLHFYSRDLHGARTRASNSPIVDRNSRCLFHKRVSPIRRRDFHERLPQITAGQSVLIEVRVLHERDDVNAGVINRV